jgi:hypothetical protein
MFTHQPQDRALGGGLVGVATRDNASTKKLGPALCPLTHDALDHHGRDAREHGFGHRG